ncbi:hypothetical protein HPB50_021468 [Hyalomma asiaticum]|uniref:Uncharacterized protein n=1 Tax=Hyalomma asiaticum TaxID=266040 RepID=A0ACB7RVV7_HYAAI|nr:hypothetical protein HPB50_021468 [Hyalomma asiaticum]
MHTQRGKPDDDDDKDMRARNVITHQAFMHYRHPSMNAHGMGLKPDENADAIILNDAKELIPFSRQVRGQNGEGGDARRIGTGGSATSAPADAVAAADSPMPHFFGERPTANARARCQRHRRWGRLAAAKRSLDVSPEGH